MIVDDSAFMRKVISDIVNRSDRLEVIGTARNGKDGLKKIRELRPDVITLDVEMPEMDGLETLEKVMQDHSIPVVMLSSTTKDGAAVTVEALRRGAVDFIAKTSGAISLDIHTIEKEIQTKLVRAAQVNVDHQLVQKQSGNDLAKTPTLQPSFRHKQSLICIGVSTGGPKALQQLIMGFPKVLHAPVVIVQHMPAHFTKSLAERLNELADVEVREARHGEIIRNGVVYIAPGDYHLRVRKIGRVLALETDQSEPDRGHRPSVNRLFESVAAIKNINKIAVILTGMGSDGTEGAKKMKKADPSSVIIAESIETALIYGMPKSIAEQVDGHHIRRLDEMASTLVHLVENRGGR